MSLINDALNRAKEAQAKTEQTAPPAAELKFRAVDPRETARVSWLLPCLITAVVLTSGFLIWEKLSQRTTTRPSASPSEAPSVSPVAPKTIEAERSASPRTEPAGPSS